MLNRQRVSSTNHLPEEVWLEAVDNTAASEPAPTTKVIRSRVRKLRRMQSQILFNALCTTSAACSVCTVNLLNSQLALQIFAVLQPLGVGDCSEL